MAGMGPPPKDAAKRARRNPTVAMTILPAEGRKGRVPKWPLAEDLDTRVGLEMARAELGEIRGMLEGDVPPAEAVKLRRRSRTLERQIAILEGRIKAMRKLESELWKELWATPQSVEWARLGWTRTVAQYVRWKVCAELGDLDASKEARQHEDRLGLNPLSLLRLRWQIADAAAASTGPSARRPTQGRYGGLRVVS